MRVHVDLHFSSESTPKVYIRPEALALGASSRRACNDGAHKELLYLSAMAVAEDDGTASWSCRISSSSRSVDKFKSPVLLVRIETSSSLIICRTRLTIFPTANSAFQPMSCYYNIIVFTISHEKNFICTTNSLYFAIQRKFRTKHVPKAGTFISIISAWNYVLKDWHILWLHVSLIWKAYLTCVTA